MAPAGASANELLDVYHQAVQNDTVLRSSGFARDARLQAKPLARARLLPQIGGNYNRSDSNLEIKSTTASIDDVTGQPIPAGGTSETDTISHQVSVNLDQALFDWAAFKRLGQASSQVELAQITYRAAEQDLVLRITQLYFGVLAASDGVEFSRSENKAVERQLKQAQKRHEVGLATITDVQEAQAAYDLTIAQMLQADQALQSSRQALREVTVGSDLELTPLQQDFALPDPNPRDVQSWIDRALENNYDLAAFRLGTRIARQDVGIARAGHLPTVSAGLSYSDADNSTDSRSRGSSTRESQGRSFGLNVRLPIFSGGLVRAQVLQAKALQDQRESDEEGARRSVERQTRDAYLGVISGASQVKALRQAVVSNTTAFEASRIGFEVGTRTTVDVLNSQRDLFNAQRNYAAARYNYLLSILSLKAAAGGLGENDLQEIDALLITG